MLSIAVQIKMVRKKIKAIFKLPVTIPRNVTFAYRHRHLRNHRKIIYAITPPPRLRNIGDHAQAVAIHQWIAKHYPGFPVLEMDKDRARYYLPALKWLTGSADLILLHSGGNLGDRAMWSESIRRQIIQSFPQNKIVSLPQTIFFSDTPRGREEYENTRRIYAEHPDLTIIGRDPSSGRIADRLFPRATTFSLPDFVLSMPPLVPHSKSETPRVLLCLRNDNESILSPDDRDALAAQLPYSYAFFDTTIPDPIPVERRVAVLNETLAYFHSFDAVITDRYHGVIFSVIARIPCLVLRTVDHKLTSALFWFKEVPSVFPVENTDEISATLEQALAVTSLEMPDWNGLYFDRLPERIGFTADITNTP